MKVPLDHEARFLAGLSELETAGIRLLGGSKTNSWMRCFNQEPEIVTFISTSLLVSMVAGAADSAGVDRMKFWSDFIEGARQAAVSEN